MNSKKIEGLVVSNKMKNSVVISVEMPKIHKTYGKRFIANKRFVVHTEKEIELGKKIIAQECRPISKTKKWKVIEVVN